MTRILLLSDTHSFLDPQLFPIINECDEIWHAGDIGNVNVYDQLLKFNKRVKGVFGNIDGKEIRQSITEDLYWKVEEKTILMTHIGGSPGKYPLRIKKMLEEKKPGIFVCGHSHILKIIYDKNYNLLHLNPGAAGKEGFHLVRTALKFNIDGDKVVDMGIIELGKK
ncbi:MAG TPA: metallophosphoesterase family protein [Saprospiraceae bacterium]|nr:metallophosphoesterase family protein [Saprospiraceae bacterium]